MSVEATESEIGRLFVEAQRFSEESLTKLELQIHQILCAADDKARAILTEATQEAIEIRRQAQEAAFLSTKTAQELQSAIAGFTTVNNELVKELAALNSMLTSQSDDLFPRPVIPTNTLRKRVNPGCILFDLGRRDVTPRYLHLFRRRGDGVRWALNRP